MTMMPGPDILGTLGKRLDRIERQLAQVRVLETFGANGGPLGTYVTLAVFTKTGISDNTATAIFTVTTADEDGADGGAWVADLLILAGVDIGAASGQGAAKAQRALVTHAMNDIAVVDTSVDTLHTGTVADTSGGLATIDTITVTYVETSAYVTTVKLTINVSGFFSSCQATVLVSLAWMGFSTAPVVAAA